MTEYILTFMLGMAGYAIYSECKWNSTPFLIWAIVTLIWLCR